MTHPNPERDKHVRRIRERWSQSSFPETIFTAHAKQDVDFLLSLLDNQATLARELAIIVDVATDEDPGTSLSKLHRVQHDAATRMRDLCVDKVREFDDWAWCRCSECRADARAHAVDVHASLNTLADELQSLTLDQVEQGKSK